MSYQIAESATLTTAAGNYLIASDAYVTDPDYKILTMNGAKVVYSGMNVVSGGTAQLGGGAILSGAAISAGGSLYFTNSASAIGLTVKSGGSAGGAAWAQNYEDLTLESGAQLSVAAGSLRGRNNDIKAGTLTGAASIASDSVNGVLYGVTQTGAAIQYFDIVLSNYVNNGGFTYICANASAYDLSAIKANTGVGLAGGYACNLHVTNGNLWIHDQDSNTAVKLGGAATNIAKGHVYHCNADGKTNNDADMYAADGVLYGVTVKLGGTANKWLRNLQIFEGLRISAPVVSSGGTLTIGSGGIGSAVTVSAGGKTVISANGQVNAATVAGTLEMWGNATVSALTVKTGGLVSMANTGAVFRDGLTVENGGHAYLRACVICGPIDVKAGTLSGNLSVASDSVDGVAYGVTQTAGAHTYCSGVVISNYINNGACYTYLSSGGQIRNGSAFKTNGGFGLLSGGYLYNAWISGGSLWMQHSAATGQAPVSLGGAETYIKQGQVYHCTANGKTNQDANMYAENGVLYGVTLKASGQWTRDLTILEGLTVSGAVMSSGGSLTLGSGGIGENLQVKGYGRLYVKDGGVVNGVTGPGGMYVSANGVANDVTVETTGLIVVSGATVNRLTVSTGQNTGLHAHFSAGAVVNDLNIYGDKNIGQYDVKAYSGAVLSKVYHSGGGLWAYGNAVVKELNIEKGETVFQDTTYASDVRVAGSGAYLYIRNGALAENVRMSGGNARFEGGTIRNATFEGDINQMKCGANFRMESATFIDGAVLSATSGGSLNSATIGSHAVILVSSGAQATNVVVSGNDWDGRLRIYDGGHVSGVTLLGTAGD